jgi:hypothetical protein
LQYAVAFSNDELKAIIEESLDGNTVN